MQGIIWTGEATAARRAQEFALLSGTDGSPVTGATVTATVSTNGAAPAAAAGVVTEIGGGLYSYAPAAAEYATPGTDHVFTFTATGAVPAFVPVSVVDYDPYAAPSTDAEVATAVRTELSVELGRIDVALSTLATGANLATVDTVVDSILALLQDGTVGLAALETLVDELETRLTAARAAKLDSLTFTKANELDVNLQSINDVTLVGDGSTTPWGP